MSAEHHLLRSSVRAQVFNKLMRLYHGSESGACPAWLLCLASLCDVHTASLDEEVEGTKDSGGKPSHRHPLRSTCTEGGGDMAGHPLAFVST